MLRMVYKYTICIDVIRGIYIGLVGIRIILCFYSNRGMRIVREQVKANCDLR